MGRARCHHPANDLLAWYVNGSLEDAEETSVQEHLEDCRICSGEVESLARVAGIVRERKVPILATDDAGGSRRRPLYAIAAAVLVIAAVGLGWVLTTRGPSLESTFVVDLKGGLRRDDAGPPKFSLPRGADSVAIKFAVLGEPAAPYRIELRGPSGVLLIRDEDRLLFDAVGVCTYTLPARLLRSRGAYELLVTENKPAGAPRVFRYPFRLEPSPAPG